MDIPLEVWLGIGFPLVFAWIAWNRFKASSDEFTCRLCTSGLAVVSIGIGLLFCLAFMSAMKTKMGATASATICFVTIIAGGIRAGSGVWKYRKGGHKRGLLSGITGVGLATVAAWLIAYGALVIHPKGEKDLAETTEKQDRWERLIRSVNNNMEILLPTREWYRSSVENLKTGGTLMQFGRDNADAGCTVMVFHSDHDDEDWLNQMIGTYQSQDNVQWENASAYRGPVIEGVLGHGSFINVTPNLNFMIWIASPMAMASS